MNPIYGNEKGGAIIAQTLIYSYWVKPLTLYTNISFSKMCNRRSLLN